MADNEAFREAVPEDMQEYHNSGAYYKQDYEMKKLVCGNGVSAYFREVCLVRVSDGTILAGTGIWNGRPIAELYTDAAQQLAVCAVNEEKYLTAEVKIGEREYFLGPMPTASRRPPAASLTVQGISCCMWNSRPPCWSGYRRIAGRR